MIITTFASGSSGNCVLASLGGAHFLLDCGISFRRVRAQLALSGLKPEDLSAVLITHDHSDHISGLATMVKYCPVPVCVPRSFSNRLLSAVPGLEERLNVIPVGEGFTVAGVAARAFPTPHDASGSVGYRLEGPDGVFALATDMGEVTEDVLEGLSGARVALVEANHDIDMLRAGPYPVYLKRRILSGTGHLSNDNCAALAALLADSGTRCLILGHLSRENNTPALALSTVRAALAGREVSVCVAPAAERLTVEMEAELCCP